MIAKKEMEMTSALLNREIARVHQQQLRVEADHERLARQADRAPSWQTWIEMPAALLRLTSRVNSLMGNRLVWGRAGQFELTVSQG